MVEYPQLVLIIVGIGGALTVVTGLIEEVGFKKNRYHTLYFGTLFALIGIVGNAAYMAGKNEGYKKGQVDGLKGEWKYSIIFEPKFEIKERVIEK